jgi:hypothetical protein
MLNRIKWASTGKNHVEDGMLINHLGFISNNKNCLLDESDEQSKERNKCVLLWEVRKRIF